MSFQTAIVHRRVYLPLAHAIGVCLFFMSQAHAEEAVNFSRDVKPLLLEHCSECHAAEAQESGLRLDSGAALLEGGYSGPAVVAGKSGDSLLIQAVRGDHEDVAKMPPEGPGLRGEQIDLLARWVDQGANVPDESATAVPRKSSDHWSFQPLASVDPPELEGETWIRNPIDEFILARLQAENLSPSSEAEKTTLIRRLSLDLIGLPPTIAEIDAFLADEGDRAYQRLVSRTLSSPHYGERWGRHWLDLARYADSNGYTIDNARSIWKYRDWVIDALNRDLPFDQFTVEQIAGDLLPNARTDQIIATGFHRNTMVNEEGGTDKEQFRVEAVVDRIATTGAAFLGLTLGCARCHDHKYDPISQREFYELFAIFNNADEPTLPVPTPEQAEKINSLMADISDAREQLAKIDDAPAERQAEWEREIAQRLQIDWITLEATAESSGGATITSLDDLALTPKTREALMIPSKDRTEEQRKLAHAAFLKADPDRQPLVAQISKLESQKKKIDESVTTTLVMRERKQPRDTHIHLRGDFLRHGAAVLPDVPKVFPALEARGDLPDRLDFAYWLVDPENPLTARVTVNRIWQRYFGRGLVATENDFGTQGDSPSHPKLLDWLAGQLIASHWSLKDLHRLIVTSATYRQSSLVREDLAAADPYNILLGRQQRLRLEAESIRDVALAASGLLSDRVGGPGVFPPQPEDIYRFTQQKRDWTASKGADRHRRGMYTFLWRSSPYPFLKTFDAPDATVACTRRPRSNTPLQALTLANDAAFFEIAQAFAVDLLSEDATSDQARIRFAFRRCLAREPSARELTQLLNYLQAQQVEFAQSTVAAEKVAGTGFPAETERASAAAWIMIARVMLNLDEFITRE